MRLSQRKGIALVAAIMLLAFAAIAVLGIVTFITKRLSQEPVEKTFLDTIYLAQAGINNAVYFFRYHDLSANGYFSLGQTNVDAGNFFVLSATAADLLMVDASASTLTGSNCYVSGWNIQNATNSATITIASITVSWSGVSPSNRLSSIYLNNTQIWGGNGKSGGTCDVSDFTLNAVPAVYLNNSLRFNKSMAGAAVDVTFNMSDGSSRALTIYPASESNNFTVTSMGQTTGSGMSRTIQAVYNARTGTIDRCAEI